MIIITSSHHYHQQHLFSLSLSWPSPLPPRPVHHLHYQLHKNVFTIYTRKTYFVIFHFNFTFDIRAFACSFQGRYCKTAIHFWFLFWPIACNHRLVNTNEIVKTLNKLSRLLEIILQYKTQPLKIPSVESRNENKEKTHAFNFGYSTLYSKHWFNSFV